jgi:hypothetical protein
VKKRVVWFPNRAFLLNRESEFAAPEKKSDAIYWFWLPVKLANPDIKDEKLHSKISPVDFASPVEYFAEKPGN